MISMTKEELVPVILTGHRKSGTSVFHRLFDNIDNINLYPVDISILYAYFPCFTGNAEYCEAELRSRAIQVFRKSLGFVNDENSVVKLDLDDLVDIFSEKIMTKDLRDKSEMILAVYETWASYQKIQTTSLPFVFKETSQAIFFKYFKEKFPKLKMISLIRDPRDNYAALSVGVDKYYSKFGEESIDVLASLINRVRMDLMAAKKNQQLYPESFLAIRFEDLMAEPEKVMRKVAAFLGIEYVDSMLTPTIMGQPYRGNSHEGKVFSGLSAQNVGSWNQRISDNEAMIIEYWLADVMDYWDYDVKFNFEDSQSSFTEFYEMYNCKYFYHDGFETP